MAPTLPFLIRSTMYSSLRSDFDSFGPLPAWRPPSWWQKPQVVANIFPPSMSSGEASACGSGFEAPAELDCWANEAVGSPDQRMARAATITNGICIPPSAFTATYRPQERRRVDRKSGNVLTERAATYGSAKRQREIDHC